jgi:transposase InsO family protein
VIDHVRSVLSVSERRACAALGQHRSTQRKVPRGAEDEERLTADMIALARQYGRYGYRKIAEFLRRAGWQINDKRVERLWRREGLKVPARQPRRGRLWLTDGSCIRLRAEYRNHVWSYDFVEDRTHDGRKFRMLNIVDEFTHECLTIRVSRKLKSIDVIDALSDLFILRGVPGHIRSDNGPEFVAKAVQDWITAVGAKTAYIAPGSPWENGYIESFMYGRPLRCKVDIEGGAAWVGCVHVCGLLMRPMFMTAGPDGVRGSTPHQRIALMRA